MVIASNTLDFQVVFTQKRGEQIKEFRVEQFFDNEFEFYEQREEVFVELKENIDLYLTFQSDQYDSRLYMDGIEALPERLLKTDPLKGEVYLVPSFSEYELFSNTLDYFPLIPGFYRLLIKHGEKTYFSWIKILPKQMKESQWEIMKDELEKELSGLSHDLILNKNGLKPASLNLTQSLLGQFVVIKKRFPSVMAALSDLYRKINYRISKDYVLLPKEKIRIIDEQTIKYRLRHPENENAFRSPVSNISYDLPENQMLKKIIQSASKTLGEFSEAIDNMKKDAAIGGTFRTPSEEERNLQELEKLSERANKMRGAFQWMKTAPWYEEVGLYRSTSIPQVMSLDPRYRTLFQLNRELENEKVLFEMNKAYSYQWKRTDKLYEIWGIIQFIKVLSCDQLGFTPTEGWIFNKDVESQRILMPTLPSETKIKFIKGEMELDLVYEALLPTQSRLTNEKDPLYTRGTHTCPDGRLDVYKNEEYIGSIIFDFKYRPKKSIWDQERILSNQQTGTMQQLVSYGDNLHSPYLFSESQKKVLGAALSPIQEVWAIYPNQYGDQHTFEFSDHNLRLIELTPGSSNEHLVEELKRGLNGLLKRKDIIYHLQALMS